MRLFVRIAGGIVVVLVLLAAALATYIYATAITPSRPVGFQQVRAADPGRRSIPVAIWYPSRGKSGFVLLGSSGMRVVSDGAVDGTGLPLVIMSHGTGGSALGHADTAIALAEQGFIVAAPTHPGDNIQENSDVGQPEWMVDRARHLSRTIDAVLGTWKDRARVDPARIGVFGLSAGATTALVSLGGKPDLSRIAAQCAKQPEFVCKIMQPERYRDLPSPRWIADPRIKAAVLAAPGLGFTFEPDGLAAVRAPIQLWAGTADQTVPFATNTAVVDRLLPRRPELHVVPGAAHLSFLMPCGPIGPPAVCGERNGFDRARFHQVFNHDVAAFFRRELPAARG
jgi:predicted dienelactone hydrolase